MNKLTSVQLIPVVVTLALSACAPSAQAVQTAIAQTQAANPTATATITSTPVPSSTPTPSPTATPVPTATIAPCLNEASFGTLNMETQQVCMQQTYYPCLRWDEVTTDMKDSTVCVRGALAGIDITWVKKWNRSHWEFSDNHTGFFAVSDYQGWHPETGKNMQVGDCIAMIGTVQVFSNGRPYIFWGANSIYRSYVRGARYFYFEHPDLWVIEGNPSFCQ